VITGCAERSGVNLGADGISVIEVHGNDNLMISDALFSALSARGSLSVGRSWALSRPGQPLHGGVSVTGVVGDYAVELFGCGVEATAFEADQPQAAVFVRARPPE